MSRKKSIRKGRKLHCNRKIIAAKVRVNRQGGIYKTKTRTKEETNE
jgi:hypothetical protein